MHPDFVDLPADAAKRKQNYPPLPLLEGNAVLIPEVDGTVQSRLTTDYTERAVKFIEESGDEPFFLYVPHTMVHVPLFVSEKFAGKSGAGLFGDVMMEVDWSVGEIVAAVQRAGVAENTLIIFTSDNGPWLSYGSHYVLAGTHSFGHRVFGTGVHDRSVADNRRAHRRILA
jgi:arylsulfatase A-like enzyme